VTSGKGFRLKDHDPADTAGHLLSRRQAEAMLTLGVHRLSQLQEQLYAQNRWAMLCVLQAMVAAGKDSTIKHVMSGVNPQGVQVTSFKAPGSDALAHDFLWRANRALPARGHIGIFNRSHYEEVLVVRVHPEILHKQQLPQELLGKKLWDQRLEAIAAFERHLARQGTVVLKFFLNLSREEQKRRFLDRLNEPDKHWKFSINDMAERAFWDEYQDAYQQAIAATAAPDAPWFVVPADHKWFTRLIVVAAMIEALDRLDLRCPELSPEEEAALVLARQKLEGGG
jgi:PPK2 family polyphosphate:nucleotide phosphotransferase